VKSGVFILRDRARWVEDLRREHRKWRQALEMLGWKRRLVPDRRSASRTDTGPALALKS
jgi:hypothetical protein